MKEPTKSEFAFAIFALVSIFAFWPVWVQFAAIILENLT